MITTKEQSKNLIELGLDIKTSDAHDNEWNLLWTVDGLLGIIERSSERFEMHLRIDKKWNIFVKPEKENWWKDIEKTDFFDGIYETVCWLLQNKYIKYESDK